MPTSPSRGRILRRLVPAVLIAAAAACGHFQKGGGPAPAAILFTNESLDQADVYAVASGVDARRIGTVMSGRTDTLYVPAEMTSRGTVDIIARIFARNIAPRTGPVSVYPGEVYRVRLQADEKLLSFLPAQ